MKPPAGLSLRGEDEKKTLHHLQVVSTLLWRFFEEADRVRPARVINGGDVMKTLGLPSGPKVGKVLDRVRELQAEGKIHNRAEALAALKSLA